jgi:hypothetical protein
MNHVEITQHHSERTKRLKQQEQNELDELKEQYQRGKRDIEERYSQERASLAAEVGALWSQYKNQKSDLNAMSDRVTEANRLMKLKSAGERIKLRHNLSSSPESYDDMIDELEQRIAKSWESSSRDSNTLKVIERMRTAILELGGTPKPDPDRRGIDPSVFLSSKAELSDEEMNDILNQNKAAPGTLL